MDLAKMYIWYVLEVEPEAIGNAEAYWNRYNSTYLQFHFDKIPNTPSFVPQKGDIAVWGTKHGKYGHIAICTGEGTTSWFNSYDQNWVVKKMHKVKHSYKDGFEGVLRPKDQSKINGQVMKYRVGQRVLVNIPIKFTGATEGEKALVESNGYQFWMHKSVIKNGRVYGLATVMEVCSGYYKLRIFEGKNACYFDCIEEYMG